MGCGDCAFQPGARGYGPFSNGQRYFHAPTTICGTADGTRRSTVGTLNMDTWAGTGEALAWDIASDVPSTSPRQGINSGAHRKSYSMHTYAFKRSCTHDSCNEPKLEGPRSTIDEAECEWESGKVKRENTVCYPNTVYEIHFCRAQDISNGDVIQFDL